MPPRIYLAGPEVFLPNALEQGAEKVAICAKYGLQGVFPLDTAPGMPPATDHRSIYQICLYHLHHCDAMIANVSPYRGVFGDTGTLFEVGYYAAQSKPIMGYTGVLGTIKDRLMKTHTTYHDAMGRLRTYDHLEVEDFGCSDNLMIDAGIEASGGYVVKGEDGLWGLESFEKAVQAMQKRWSA